MQVNKIQASNYNTNFGRLGHSLNLSSSTSGVEEVLDSYCKSNKSKKSVKDLVETLIDKCDKQELKQLAEDIQKKLRTPNVDTTWL